MKYRNVYKRAIYFHKKTILPGKVFFASPDHWKIKHWLESGVIEEVKKKESHDETEVPEVGEDLKTKEIKEE